MAEPDNLVPDCLRAVRGPVGRLARIGAART
ncbi:hypothetical protein Mnod_5239 [Methylobacterium nodulans ORS 2060]|uniref:Uncharacterized protein n=1 Tax=Methylobacterium nodulans (strain LMG 21967 / CNCM I-2342 / ORS 2060) TaxID=460265 RepID=B8IL86_METNO|nr:hypothetical protein Mnod_5239 [Methylobacterium nodulans ORS 2060]